MPEEWDRGSISWRQGNLLTKEALEGLGFNPEEIKEGLLAVIASHDCDIANHPAQEPNVEIIVGHRIDKLNGNHSNAKNPRKLHCEFSGNEVLCAEFLATNRQLADKQKLASFEASDITALPPDEKNTLQKWLASRYRRSAFSDEFDRRLKSSKLAEKIGKIVKPTERHIIAILFDVDEGEELDRAESEVYILDVVVLYSVRHDPGESEDIAQNVAHEIVNAFESKLLDENSQTWSQIELRYCEAISEEVLTYHEFSQMKPWRLDHLSLRANPQSPAVES